MPSDFIINNRILTQYTGHAAHVQVPDGVLEIGESAFSECSSLRSVVLPDSVVEVNLLAFANCDNLQSVVLPAGLRRLRGLLFDGCFQLKSLTLPEGLSGMSLGALMDCGLESIVLPDSITELGVQSFMDCYNLKCAALPAGITLIPEEAFSGCSSLQSIVIPDRVTLIDKRAFAGCRSLQSVVIPDSVTMIQCEAFADCTALRQVTLPANCRYLSDAFPQGCRVSGGQSGTFLCQNGVLLHAYSNDEFIAVPPDTRIIGSHAFDKLPQLRSVMIPDTVIRIDSGAFADCTGLQYVAVPARCLVAEDSFPEDCVISLRP